MTEKKITVIEVREGKTVETVGATPVKKIKAYQQEVDGKVLTPSEIAALIKAASAKT